MIRVLVLLVSALGCVPALAAAPKRHVVEAVGVLGHPGDAGLFEIPEGWEGVVEEYRSEPPKGRALPNRRTTVFSSERRAHIWIKADPTGDEGTVLGPGHYRLIADGGPGAKARLVYRLEPPTHVPSEPGKYPPGQVSGEELGYRGPPVRSFTIVPLGARPIAETEGLVEVLSRRFPGLDFRLAPLRPLPEGVLNEEGQVRAEVLASKLPERSGYLAVVAKDLTEHGVNFVFGLMESSTASGVVSVARFRTRWGKVAPEDVVLEPHQRDLARERLHNQVTSTLGKMLGVRWPCHRLKCVLRFVRGITAFDEKGGEFCETHQREVREAVARIVGEAK